MSSDSEDWVNPDEYLEVAVVVKRIDPTGFDSVALDPGDLVRVVDPRPADAEACWEVEIVGSKHTQVVPHSHLLRLRSAPKMLVCEAPSPRANLTELELAVGDIVWAACPAEELSEITPRNGTCVRCVRADLTVGLVVAQRLFIIPSVPDTTSTEELISAAVLSSQSRAKNLARIANNLSSVSG